MTEIIPVPRDPVFTALRAASLKLKERMVHFVTNSTPQASGPMCAPTVGPT